MMTIFILLLVIFSISQQTSFTKYQVVPGFIQVYTVQKFSTAVSGNFASDSNGSRVGCRASDEPFIVQCESKCKQLEEIS